VDVRIVANDSPVRDLHGLFDVQYARRRPCGIIGPVAGVAGRTGSARVSIGMSQAITSCRLVGADRSESCARARPADLKRHDSHSALQLAAPERRAT
jgi:hypothetical protein